MPVSMGDVARHAGVSQRTVSNVVNDYVHVAPETRARVEASLKKLGYRPNTAARQLRSGRTGTITLAVPGFAERYFADLAEAIIRRSAARGLRVLVETTGSRERELDLLTGGGAQLTDGVIMSAVMLGPGDEGGKPEYPLVLVGDRDLKGPVDHVGIPNRAAARAAVEHLLEAGSRRIALLGADRDLAATSSRLRRRGYDDALGRAGIEPDPDLVLPGAWSYEGGEQAIERLLESGIERPDGIFAMNDSMALGAIRALTRAGIRVPEDVAVIGFDDTREARFATPSLSSVSPSLDEIAESALELLTDQGAAGSERESQHRHVAFEIKARASTAR